MITQRDLIGTTPEQRKEFVKLRKEELKEEVQTLEWRKNLRGTMTLQEILELASKDSSKEEQEAAIYKVVSSKIDNLNDYAILENIRYGEDLGHLAFINFRNKQK